MYSLNPPLAGPGTATNLRLIITHTRRSSTVVPQQGITELAIGIAKKNFPSLSLNRPKIFRSLHKKISQRLTNDQKIPKAKG